MSFSVYCGATNEIPEIKNNLHGIDSTIKEKEVSYDSKNNLLYVPDLIEDQMLCFFHQKEFINSSGHVDEKKISNKKLPALGEEEMARLNQMIHAYSPIPILGYDLPSQVNEIPDIIRGYVKDKYQKEVQTQLVGSAVFYVLGVSYVYKAMEVIGFEDFFNFLTSQNLSFEFNDADLKIFSETIDISDCREIKERIVTTYAQRLKNYLFHLSEQKCSEIIYSYYVHKNGYHGSSNLDRFSQKPIDFTIFSKIIEISGCLEITEDCVRVHVQKFKDYLFQFSEQKCCEIIHNYAFKNVFYVHSDLDHFYLLSLQSHKFSIDYTVVINSARETCYLVKMPYIFL